jgi:hypothetical protein
LWPTPAAHEPGWKHIEIEDKSGNDPKHWNQRFYDKKTGRVVQKGLTQIARMWPTPQARDHFPPHTPEYIAEKKAQGHGMRNLNDEVNLWPTPTARDWKDGTAASCANVPTNGLLGKAVHMLPTPTANRRDGLQSHGVNVVEGSLNPAWVEILQGYPPNWTDLSAADQNTGTETGSAASRESPKECQTVQTD